MVAILPDVDSVKATLCGGTQEARGQVSAKLERLQAETQSAVTSLMDKTGYSIAASNWNRAESFVGHDNSFREYFRSAFVQPTAMEFALGTVSGKPGLDLSHDVREGEALLGVVVKVEFDTLEAAWKQSPNTTHVTKADCRVIITAEPEQRFTGPAGAALHPSYRPAGAGNALAATMYVPTKEVRGRPLPVPGASGLAVALLIAMADKARRPRLRDARKARPIVLVGPNGNTRSPNARATCNARTPVCAAAPVADAI